MDSSNFDSTPMMTDSTHDNKFYVKIKYSSHEIQLRLPCERDYTCFLYKNTGDFIDDLKGNQYDAHHGNLRLASNFKIYIYQHNIQFVYKKVDIKIENTEFIRNSLANVLSSYLNYLYNNFK